MLFQVQCELTRSYFMKKRELNIKTFRYLVDFISWNKETLENVTN